MAGLHPTGLLLTGADAAHRLQELGQLGPRRRAAAIGTRERREPVRCAAIARQAGGDTRGAEGRGIPHPVVANRVEVGDLDQRGRQALEPAKRGETRGSSAAIPLPSR